MPLRGGDSDETIKHNIEVEMKAGKPRKQAVAIALDHARRTAKGKPRKGLLKGAMG